MVARLFEPAAIRNANDLKDIRKYFFSDFPYSVSDFRGIDQTESDDDLANDLVNDFRMLSLLMIKEKTPETDKLKESFKDQIPFCKCSSKPFCEMDKEKFAALFFPLRTYGKNAIPSWGLAVKSSGGKSFFFNAYTGDWSCRWDYSSNGPSCRLAEHLAERLLANGSEEHIAAAAKEWIVTGDVDENGNVRDVGLGNKLRLTTDRKFIVPLENIREISAADAENKIIKSADNITSAWNLVTGAGAKPLEESDYPEDIDELHVLVGGNIKAQVASIILSHPKKVVLWHSEKSKSQADDIIDVVGKYNGTKADKNVLSSKDFVEAEDTLKKFFGNLSLDKKIIFNVTSGNRLMSYAVQSIARAYPNVELIYRDIDGDEDKEEREQRKYIYNRLIYSEFPPYCGKYSAVIGNDINIDFLRGNDPKNEKHQYKTKEEFFYKLKEKEEKNYGS